MSLVPQPGLKRFIIGLSVWTVILMAGIPALYSAGPVIEERLFPVISSFTITDVVRHDDVEVYGSYHKLRDCGIIRRQWYVGTPDTSLTLMSSDEHPGFKAEGLINIGPIVFDKDKLEDGDSKIYGIVVYKCHPLWNITASIGPFDLRQFFRHPFSIPPEIILPR